MAGDVQDVAREPSRVELLRRERRRHAAVGSERAVACLDDGDDDAGGTRADRPEQLDSVPRELTRDELPSRIVAALCDARRLRAERRRPRRDVRRLAARTGARRRANIAAGSEGLGEPHDHVEQDVAKGRDAHGTIVP